MAGPKSESLSASLEDYLEAIYNLAGDTDVARSKDIAKLLGVSRASVTGALRTLKKKRLVNYKPYDYVTLTEAGKTAADKITRKHDILKSFFADVLGIDANIAHQAACKAEHVLGPQVIAKLLRFIEFVTRSGKNGYNLSKEFERFCKNRLQNKKRRKTET